MRIHTIVISIRAISLVLFCLTAGCPVTPSGPHLEARSVVFSDLRTVQTTPSTLEQKPDKTSVATPKPPPPRIPPVPPSKPAPAPVQASEPVAAPMVLSGPRYALVVGNSGYPKRSLPNAKNDADDMAATLTDLKFEVTKVLDADHEKLEKSIQELGNKLRQNAVGVFYYSGHAVQHSIENYMIPIDAIESVTVPEHLKYKTVNINYVLGVMKDAGNSVNIVFLDACRDNPFPSFTRGGVSRGLAPITNAPQGSLVAYATAPGQTAEEGEGRNSPYTKHLLKNLKESRSPITDILTKVNAGVLKETGGRQQPSFLSSLTENFYF